MTLEEIKAIHVEVLKWFDRRYGNTYFAGKIEIDLINGDRCVVKMPMEYGYGEQWNQAALDTFCRAVGIDVLRYPNGNKKTAYLTSLCKQSGVLAYTSVSDTTRQRDLKRIGG